jgi:hypothetical protein
MNHIRLTIAKQLLEDKQAEVMATIKPRTKRMTAIEHAKMYKAAHKELKAIGDELWLINNW